MASVEELQELLKSGNVVGLREKLEAATVPVLKQLCKKSKIVHSKKKKQDLVETLLGLADLSGADQSSERQRTISCLTDDVQKVLDNLPKYDAVSSWNTAFLLEAFSYDNIYEYLVEARDKTLSERQHNNFKSLKGYGYFTSGWVSNVWMCYPDNAQKNYVFARGHVYQSYPSREKSPYSVFVTMSPRGDVFGGSCKCVAGLGESCSHVAALFFSP